MGVRFDRGTYCRCRIAGDLIVVRGLSIFARKFEMLTEAVSVVLDALGEDLFYRFGDALVKFATPAVEDGRISRVACEFMLEHLSLIHI